MEVQGAESIRTFWWMQSLQVLAEAVGDGLCYSFLAESAGGYKPLQVVAETTSTSLLCCILAQFADEGGG